MRVPSTKLRIASVAIPMALAGCGAEGVPFFGPSECPLTSTAIIDVRPVRIARGEEATLTVRYDRDVLPPELPDHFAVELLEEAGEEARVIGAWPPAAEPEADPGAVRDLDVLGQRAFLLDVFVGEEHPPGRYLLAIDYSPDPEACPGPVHEVGIEVD